MYDLAENAARPFVPGSSWQPSFTRDVYPVLQRTVFMQWTNSRARSGHGSGPGDFLDPAEFKKLHDPSAPGSEQARLAVWSRLRDPQNPDTSGNMPALSGLLSLTVLQYQYFTQWKDGDFVDDWNPAWNPSEPPEPPLEAFPITEQPHVLTLAALGTGVGGSFFPGIEAGSKMADEQTYQAPFRISRLIAPGELTQSLSVPWQADFKLCVQSWWPSARPGSVIVEHAGGLRPEDWARGVSTNQEMVDHWSQLGFIIRQSQSPLRYTEQQRTLTKVTGLRRL